MSVVISNLIRLAGVFISTERHIRNDSGPTVTPTSTMGNTDWLQEFIAVIICVTRERRPVVQPQRNVEETRASKMQMMCVFIR